MFSQKLKPVADAMIENLSKKSPNDVVFIVGKKEYKSKEVIKEIKKGSNLAVELLQKAIEVSCGRQKKFGEEASQEEIEAAVKMFKG